MEQGTGTAPEVAAPGAPLVWPSVVTLVLGLIGTLLSGCLLGAFLGQHADGRPMSQAELLASPTFVIIATAQSQLVLLVAVWKLPALLDDLGPETWRARVRWLPQRFNFLDVVLIAVPLQVIGSFVLLVLTQTDTQPGILASLRGASEATDASGFAVLVLVGAVAPGIGEELAFRGLLQRRLIERWGPLVGIGVSSLMFGLWHFDLRQGLMAVAIGLWIGWCAHRQKTVVNVAFAHVLSNAFALVANRNGFGGIAVHSVGAMIVSGVAAGLCVGLMWRRTR